MHMDKSNIYFSNVKKNCRKTLVRERLKSYPRVLEISLSCTPPGVRFYSLVYVL